MYRISDISTAPELSMEDILHRVVDLIPPSMQYPMAATACLKVDDVSYSTEQYSLSANSIESDILLNGIVRGKIQVSYPEAAKDQSALAFLPEESQLLRTIAHQVALIIERKSIEETNNRLQEQLRHADRLATLGQLSAGIAHEINEPLATILGFAQLIASELPADSEWAPDLKKITDASLHAREVVRKLMLFSRQMPPRKEPLDLNKLINDGLYFLETRCRRQGITLERELANNMPLVVADPGQIHQVLVNLTVNAMQATPEGGTVRISTSVADQGVVFSVSDTGIGISEELLSKIFMPFFTTKDIDQGTGLGLSVVHGIVSAHNGRINVESASGKGSVFTVFLPGGIAQASSRKKHREPPK